jgi:hypothetical protein
MYGDRQVTRSWDCLQIFLLYGRRTSGIEIETGQQFGFV